MNIQTKFSIGDKVGITTCQYLTKPCSYCKGTGFEPPSWETYDPKTDTNKIDVQCTICKGFKTVIVIDSKRDLSGPYEIIGIIIKMTDENNEFNKRYRREKPITIRYKLFSKLKSLSNEWVTFRKEEDLTMWKQCGVKIKHENLIIRTV